MSESLWLQLLQQHRAIAVIRASEIELGYKIATSVATGGMRLIEITWNSDHAGELIHQLRSELPNCTIGTGTILNKTSLKAAIAAGAQFLFTPHVHPELIQAAIEVGVPIIPGALSPTEIVTAWQAGATCVKVFPINAVGGTAYIKNLQGPLGHIPLIPTGGVTFENAQQFIDAGAIAVGLASDLFPKQLISTGQKKQINWEAIAQRSLALVQRLTNLNVEDSLPATPEVSSEVDTQAYAPSDLPSQTYGHESLNEIHEADI